RAIPPRPGTACFNCRELLVFSDGKPPVSCTNQGCGVRVWLRELLPTTPEAARKRLAADLRGGPQAAAERERALARSDAAELEQAMSRGKIGRAACRERMEMT